MITNPVTGKIVVPSGSTDQTSTYTSFVNGQTLYGAQDIELDVPVFNFDAPTDAGAHIRVWGISQAEISQANNLNGFNVVVYAGMQKGLPLANPAQNGIILQGWINQCWGNWIGMDRTLDMIVQAGQSPTQAGATGGTGSPYNPKNLPLNWIKGTNLSDAIKSTLGTAFPNLPANVNISDKLILGYDVKGYYQSLSQFASFIRTASMNIIDPTGSAGYQGVRMTVKENSINVVDGTTTTSPIMLQFQDLIGQPTWYAPNQLNFKTVLRADISVNDYIQFPPDIAYTSTQQGTPPFGPGITQQSLFKGIFTITYMQHFGRFRQADAASWVSNFNVSAVPGDANAPISA